MHILLLLLLLLIAYEIINVIDDKDNDKAKVCRVLYEKTVDYEDCNKKNFDEVIKEIKRVEK